METENCFYCGEVFPTEDLRSVDSHLICEDCQDNILSCSRCGVNFLSDNNAGTDAHPLCVECREAFYTFCSRCDSLITLDEAYYIGSDDSGPYCEYCYAAEERERYEDETYIHEYSYKPKVHFLGNDSNRFIGLELEIEYQKSESAAKSILEAANLMDEHIYIKNDSSLNSGMEIVSHAATVSYHLHKFPWPQILQTAVSLHFKSNDTGTCGLHLHVNRDSFSDDTEEADYKIGLVLLFVEHFWPEMVCFSRRNEKSLTKWASRNGYNEDSKLLLNHAKKLEQGRYSCINLCPSSTIEWRIFNGTLNLNTLYATIELVDEVCRLADELDDYAINRLSWSEFVRNIDKKTKPELIKYLKIRQLYINNPVKSSLGVEV